MCVAKFAIITIIKGALQYLSRYSSDFDEILYADANFDFEDGNVTEDQNYTIREGGQTPCWKLWLLKYFSAVLYD